MADKLTKRNEWGLLNPCDGYNGILYVIVTYCIVIGSFNLFYLYNEPPLHNAIRHENYDRIIKELEQGANPLEDYAGSVLYTLFKEHNRPNYREPFDDNADNIMNTLIKHGAQLHYHEFFRLLYSSSYDESRLERVIKCVDVNIKDDDGNTVLHHTMKDRKYDLAKFLIAHGADRGIVNNDGLTPLEMMEEERFKKLFSVTGDE